MKAKCPHCFGEKNDCPECEGSGQIEIKLAEGTIFTKLCTNKEECGFSNGGNISKTFPEESSGPCIICGMPTEWIPIQSIPDGHELGYTKNYNKFAIMSRLDTADKLREIIKKVRKFALENMPDREITFEEAKLLGVCRVCKGADRPTKELGSFVCNYGKEYAHQFCIDNTKLKHEQRNI